MTIAADSLSGENDLILGKRVHINGACQVRVKEEK
jgi:hypothetical protein